MLRPQVGTLLLPWLCAAWGELVTRYHPDGRPGSWSLLVLNLLVPIVAGSALFILSRSPAPRFVTLACSLAMLSGLVASYFIAWFGITGTLL